MIKSKDLFLLHQGLPVAPSGREAVAKPFSLTELACSPLAVPEAAEAACIAEGWSDTGAGFLRHAWPDLHAPLYLAGCSTSSLDVAHTLARQALLPEWGGVLVSRQTAGRGQLRREWASPEGNIYAALRLPLEYPLDTEAAAPAVGGLVAEALTRMGHRVALKWPNDILQAGVCLPEVPHAAGSAWRKVGGILLEERAGILIAGIGINLASAPPHSALRENFAFAAGRLNDCTSASSGENQSEDEAQVGNQSGFAPLVGWWTQLAGAVFSCYFQKIAWPQTSWWPSLAEQHLAFLGSTVRLDDVAQGLHYEGVLEGLCASGALRLRTRSGVMTFLSGSLTPCV